MDDQPQLAYIGMGRMGQAMAKNLVEKGNLDKPLILFNRTRSRADETSQELKHATAADTIADVILAHDITGKHFVDCSSVLPHITDQIARKVLEAGAEFVAMPVFGDPSMVVSGSLICVPAGAVSSVARIKPYTVGVVAEAIVDLSSEAPSKATLLKVIGNVIILTTIETVAETHVFAEKTGLGTTHMQSLIMTLFLRPLHAIYTRKMTSGD
ncbi:hypothetical protein VTN77DRAFT_3507 [Rasamsonia byssochlamydoides]|uniref:uncharacterized protein n=1 Tax=Rasamsonia byssochlamydoides TaxID=89139 RepID=UPI003742C94A